MPRQHKTLGERAALSAQVVREETFGLEPRVVKVGGRFYDEENMWKHVD